MRALPPHLQDLRGRRDLQMVKSNRLCEPKLFILRCRPLQLHPPPLPPVHPPGTPTSTRPPDQAERQAHGLPVTSRLRAPPRPTRWREGPSTRMTRGPAARVRPPGLSQTAKPVSPCGLAACSGSHRGGSCGQSPDISLEMHQRAPSRDLG